MEEADAQHGKILTAFILGNSPFDIDRRDGGRDWTHELLDHPAIPSVDRRRSIFFYDPEVGYVARPNGSTKWTGFGADGKAMLQFQVQSDRRSARVANRGEQNPDHVDIVFVGDSFTWGYGVEGPENLR